MRKSGGLSQDPWPELSEENHTEYLSFWFILSFSAFCVSANGETRSSRASTLAFLPCILVGSVRAPIPGLSLVQCYHLSPRDLRRPPTVPSLAMHRKSTGGIEGEWR